MKKFIFTFTALIFSQTSFGQYEIFRCGLEYTNNAKEAKERNCTRLGPRQLTAAEREKFENCKLEAAKAPTELGVSAGFRVCKDKFGQK